MIFKKLPVCRDAFQVVVNKQIKLGLLLDLPKIRKKRFLGYT